MDFLHEYVLLFLDIDRPADHSSKMLPVCTKAVAIWYQHQGLVVSDELASHLEPRPVRVNGTLLAQFLHDIGRVDDYHMLPEGGGRTNGPYLGVSQACGVEETISNLTVFLTPVTIR